MDFDDIVKIVDQVKVLEARLAAVEAERDAARAASENDREWVGRALEKQAEYLGQSQMLVAERDAARAGEARAVEFASTVKSTIEESLEWAKQDPEVAIELLKDLMNQADGIGYADELGNALDWLAQQRREAAAKENDRWANEWWELARPTSLTASDFTQRAAALRAGEVADAK